MATGQHKNTSAHAKVASPIREVKHRRRIIVKKDITKDEFLANLDKVCRPIRKKSATPVSVESQTSQSHPCDGYTERCFSHLCISTLPKGEK